jgi:hypothetical protein
MRPERVSRHHGANEQLLYFTSSSLVADDSQLVFISDRTGNPNLFTRDLGTGREVQVTRNETGYLKSYVYFDGYPYRGFGKASVSLHASSGTIYYIEGRDIRRVDIGGKAHTIAQYPEGQMTAFTHVSADGRRLCVPTVDARALDGPLRPDGRPEHNIDARVQAEGLSSYLRVFDTGTGVELVTERVENCWITHVQFSPVNSEWILYNHEWPSDCGVRRMWLFDGTRHHRLRQEGDGRVRNDWTCHEMWERDGRAIIYHGTLAGGRSYIGRMDPDGTRVIEIAIPTGCNRYGHFTTGAPGVLVSDGYYAEPGDNQYSGGDWISRVDVDWHSKTIRWTPLCRNRSSWKSQDEHPHPIIDHAMRYAYFTSDVDGKRAIYRIPMREPVEPSVDGDGSPAPQP